MKKGDTPFDRWRKGRRRQAIHIVVEVILPRYPTVGVLWGLFLAWWAERQGRREWARQCLEELCLRWKETGLAQKTPSLEGWQRDMAEYFLSELGEVEGAVEWAKWLWPILGKVALAWVEKGWYSQALKVARKVHGEVADRIWKKAAMAAVQAGQFEQALKMTRGIGSLWDQAEVLSSIAMAMERQGRLSQGLRIVEKVWPEEVRPLALKCIGEALLQRGARKQAFSILKRAVNTLGRGPKVVWWWEATTLAEIAERMTQVGWKRTARRVFTKALQIAQKIKNNPTFCDRAIALRDIAGSMARAGWKEEAQEVMLQAAQATEMCYWEGLSGALETIVAALGRWGRGDQAVPLVEAIRIEKDRAIALCRLVKGLIEGGQPDQALRIAERILDGFQREDVRVWALMEIARVIGQSGQLELAWQVLQRARQRIQAIRDTWVRKNSMGGLGVTMAEAGLIPQALQLAEQLQDVYARQMVLETVVQRMVDTGQFSQALQVLDRVEFPNRRADGLRRVAIAMLQAGQERQARRVLMQALQVADQMKSPEIQADYLRSLATAMLQAGQTRQARRLLVQVLQVVNRIESPEIRVGQLACLGMTMLQAGQERQARRVLGKALEMAELLEEARRSQKSSLYARRTSSRKGR
jgi:tetratricopeptide (TPR) repeat protein